MARHPQRPRDAEVVRTYAGFQRFVRSFAEGHLGLLVVVGPPGLGKSEDIRRATDGTGAVVLSGHASPLQVYITLFRHRDAPVILDDAQGLADRPAGLALLNGLTDSRAEKTIGWHSTCPELDRQGVPRSFTTASRACVILNRWYGAAAECAALEDRGHLLYFDPPPGEIHAYAARWFWDQAVFDYIGRHLQLLARPSCRLYLKAWERRKAGLDWQAYVLHHCHETAARLVQELEGDAECPTVTARVERFRERTGLCRATYFNIKQQLAGNGQLTPVLPLRDLPTFSLAGNRPPAPAGPAETPPPEGRPDESVVGGESEVSKV